MNRRRSTALAAIWALALAVAVAAFPAGVMGSPARGVAQASYAGVTFTYDTSLTAAVKGKTVANNVGEGGLAYDVRPEHVSFAFEGYPASGVWTPVVRVIPYAEYKTATAKYSTAGELSALEGYLGSDLSGTAPLLPPVNQVRNIGEDVTHVAGAGVTGVRLVAAYSQGIVPVAAKDLVYVFMGLTADKQYYVEAMFPVHPVAALDPLPSQVTPDSVQTHNQAVAAQLRNTAASGFTPNLELLDKMMSSLQVTATPNTPGMPRTGSAPDAAWLLVVAIAVSLLAMVAGTAVRRRAR